MIKGAETIPSDPPLLPQAAVDPSGESFGNVSGIRKRRHADLREIPEGLRYYDLGRDYQAGLQRSDSRARSGRSTVIEFPGALEAADARALANRAAERASWNHDCLSWRIAELDPQLTPGQIVRVPGKRGLWRIISWEWRNTGVELELLRLPHVADRMQAADTGTAVLQPDLPLSPTVLHAFELPWDGTGSSSERVVFAAASSASPGWPGAALFVDANGALEPLGPSGRQRCIVGHLVAPLAPADPALIDRSSNLLVDLIAPDLGLAEVSISALAAGANRALVGREVIQFANAEHLGGSRWRLSALLRGRGGTERHASIPHPEGEPFILIDDKPMRLDPAGIGNAMAIAASSLADSEPVATAIAMAGQTLTPLIPVHPKAQRLPDGSLALGWTRRARGAWAWNDLVEAPLVEEAERYRVGLGNPSSPELVWEVTSTSLTLQATTVNGLAATHPGKPIWVRQIGNHAESDPLLLFTLP